MPIQINTTSYGRGLPATHVVNCPSCNPIAKIEYSTSTRLSKVKVNEAMPTRRRGRRSRCQVVGCVDGLVNLTFGGVKHLKECLERGYDQDRMVEEVSECGKAYKVALINGEV